MPDRSHRLRRLFDNAVALPPGERGAFIREQCSDDDELRSDLEGLLRHDPGEASPPSFVELPVHDAAHAGASVADRYTLERVLGQGGMGVVWLARQRHPPRPVALKLIRPGFVGRELLRRFEVEAVALGRLAHPGIAQIHEAGTFDDGGGARPFFAMEFIEGVALTEYARTHDLRASLDLFARICDAVQHAHRKGVIHRDLKPGNILVTPTGEPKILDFGVARLTDADIHATQHTDAGRVIGTLAYMSPEQVEGRTDHLDTRTDVYALGVILYELLTGRLPRDLGNLSIAQAARRITETDAAPLTAVSRTFRGDLNTIVLRALEGNPERRYASAEALGADVRRYLRDEPIVARAATTSYQMRKFAQRYRAIVIGAGATMLALAAGLVGTTVNMVRAQRAGDRAVAMNQFLTETLATADADQGAANLLLVDALRAASDRAAEQFVDYPELEADVRQLLGTIFAKFTLHQEAAAHLSRVVKLRRDQLGPRHPLTRRSLDLYMNTLFDLTRFDEALAAAEDLRHSAPKALTDALALDARRIEGSIAGVRGDRAAEESTLRKVLAEARTALGADHEVTMRTATQMARIIRRKVRQGSSTDIAHHLDEAITAYQDVVTTRTTVSGPDARATLVPMVELADCLRMRGDLDAAAKTAQSVIERVAARYGADHEVRMAGLTILSETRVDQGRYDEAADCRIAVVESTVRRLGANSIAAMVAMGDALPLVAASDPTHVKRAEIGARYARALLEQFPSMSSHSPGLAFEYHLYLGGFLAQLGELDEAQSEFAPYLEREATLTPQQACRLDGLYGEYLLARERIDDAEARLRRAVTDPIDRNPHLWPVERARLALVRLYEATNRLDDAAAFRAPLARGQ